MEDFIQLLFKGKKFPTIITKSLIITIAFFIAVDSFTKILKDDILLLVFAVVVWFAVYMVYLIYEVEKNAKKKR